MWNKSEKSIKKKTLKTLKKRKIVNNEILEFLESQPQPLVMLKNISYECIYLFNSQTQVSMFRLYLLYFMLIITGGKMIFYDKIWCRLKENRCKQKCNDSFINKWKHITSVKG